VGKRSNAFNPISLFCIAVIGVSSFFGYQSPAPLCYWLYGFAGLVAIFAMIMFLLIFFKDPKLLQSESYRLEDKKLEIMIQKGGAIDFNPVNLTPIESEEMKKLETDSEEDNG
jgi:membrane protein YdbS with pleckstrin-like domain